MFGYKKEYEYKRISFNPNPKSPNVFLKKLKFRYKHYYKNLLNKSCNSDKKNKSKK